MTSLLFCPYLDVCLFISRASCGGGGGVCVQQWGLELSVNRPPLGAAVSLMDGLPTIQRAPPCNATNPAATNPCSAGLPNAEPGTNAYLGLDMDAIFTAAEPVDVIELLQKCTFSPRMKPWTCDLKKNICLLEILHSLTLFLNLKSKSSIFCVSFKTESMLVDKVQQNTSLHWKTTITLHSFRYLLCAYIVLITQVDLHKHSTPWRLTTGESHLAATTRTWWATVWTEVWD